MLDFKPRHRSALLDLIKELIYTGGCDCDLSYIDTSLVTDMSWLFSNMDLSLMNFNGDISSWDTSNVKDMTSMFKKSKFNQDISSWDTSNVLRMNNMFEYSEFNQDISKWNTSSVKYFNFMFHNSKVTCNLNNWDTSNRVDKDCSGYDKHIVINSPLEINPPKWVKIQK